MTGVSTAPNCSVKIMPKERLFLIDSSAYFYRAFFALPRLTTSTGFPTNAIYGFTTMLQKLLNDHAPEFIAAVFDCPEPTFRHEAYADYKANREEMPDNLSVQIPHMKEVTAAFGIAAVEKPGFEADDVIGTLARQAARDGSDVVIVSGDKDLLQLVGPHVTVLDTMKDRVFDRAAVEKKYGLGPEKLIDMFGLVGDAVDNVPGVPGVGPKTAARLLERFGSIDAVYENLESITQKKLKESLAEHRDQALLSRQLVTIDCSVGLECSWKSFKAMPPDQEALRRFFREYEFTRLLKTLDAGSPAAEKNYRLLTEPGDIRALLETLRALGRFTLDIETTSEQPMLAEIVGISFAWQDHDACYVPLAHQGLARQPDADAFLAQLKPILEDETVKKTGHNIKYEYIVLKRRGITLRGIACDTMVASYVLNPSKYRHNLDDVALDILDHRMISFKDVAGTGKKAVTFDRVPIERATEYACEDSDITCMLAGRLLPRIRSEGFESLYYEMEMPLVPVLATMEMAGVKLDTDHLRALSVEFNSALKNLEEKIYGLAGQEFNINSPRQLGGVLFEKLGLPVLKKTKTGYATDVGTLTELSKQHALPAEVLAYRGFAKLISTYIDAMPALLNPVTGRIHTSYNQTVTATGRLSSSDPNLQNIPIRTQEGRRIREAFITEPGWQLLSADYSQIELRILAHLSEDATLIDGFLKNEDIHARTASEIWGVAPAAVGADMRRDAKVINFGIIYGMSAFGLSNELGIAPGTAQEYIDSYFARYSSVQSYFDGILEQARTAGYVETLMKRRRYLPDISAGNNNVRRFAERTAINAPIQGTAADLIKIAMIRLARIIGQENLRARMIMQVHDELVFEAPEEERRRLETIVREEMEGVLALRVPLKVDLHWGRTWREAH